MATFEENSNCGQSVQGLVVISCAQNTPTNQFIEKILRHFDKTTNDCEEYKPSSLNLGFGVNIDGFELKIDNKYYSANIFLFDMKDKHLFNQRLADSVNGVLLYFDSNEDSSFDGIELCQTYINRFDNEIKLLVCQTIDDIKRQSIEKWCLDNEFELVELLPQNDGTDHHFEDVDGMTRLFQAIEAHHWPNSALKERPQYNPSHHFKDLIEKEVLNSVNDISQKVDKSDKLSDPFTDSQEIEDFENFNNLFDKFSEMKVKSSQMSETERKDYAEKVTLAFWKAIGGDTNEIDGLEDEVNASNQ